MNNALFFEQAKASLFGGRLSQTQVDGMNALLTAFGQHHGTDARHLAYLLGTVYHEAGTGMYPVREGFSANNQQAVNYVTALFNHHHISKNYATPDALTGQSYYGRGFVQITWKWNYAAFEKLLNLPLVSKPDLALQLPVAAQIAVIGMMNGIFTGKKLSDYFTATGTDWLNARRIINGMDKAGMIATYAQKFHQAITAAS